jgi:hypothetical protein
MNRDTRTLVILVGIAVASLVVLWSCNYRAAAEVM